MCGEHQHSGTAACEKIASFLRGCGQAGEPAGSVRNALDGRGVLRTAQRSLERITRTFQRGRKNSGPMQRCFMGTVHSAAVQTTQSLVFGPIQKSAGTGL